MALPVAAVLAIVSAYIVGSIDFAVVVSRMNGVDIRSVGSGNPGAANVMRALGRGPAVMVFVGDMLKGVVAAAMGMVVSGDPVGALAFGAGLAAVVGHCYPVFHRFRGGKGVATAVGMVLFTIPVGGLVLVLIWAVGARLTRISAVGSLALAVASVPVAVWQGIRGLPLLLLGVTFLLVVWRHKANIGRLLSGEERLLSRH